MAIENQPAVAGDGFVERTIDSIAVDIHFDQRRRAPVLQIRAFVGTTMESTLHCYASNK
jgi:hypothetical protein